MKNDPLSRNRALSLMVSICLLLLAACAAEPQWHGTDVSGVLPDLEFSLVNEHGEATTADDYHGKTTLLFFGFTHCPGVCPTTLGHLGAAISALDDATEVQVLLVTVDPARDTPQALEAYTRRFGPWLHGLTGSETELRALNQAYKVDYQAALADTSGQYDVRHSNAVFAFDTQGRCRLLIRDTANTAALIADLQHLLDSPGLAGTPG